MPVQKDYKHPFRFWINIIDSKILFKIFSNFGQHYECNGNYKLSQEK